MHSTVADAAASPAPVDTGVYYSGNYWNNRPEVVRYMNELATDNPELVWFLHLLGWRGRPFRRALSLNCGNGWVERELVDRGVVESAVGVDIADELLTSASAAAGGRPIDYHRHDINTGDLTSVAAGVDLVVNHAAGHHIANIDRVFRQVCELLPEDGVFVSYDYVGPHRNQYPAEQWDAIWRANEALPPRLRKQLRYASVPAMLAADPTEAIHSELILSTIRRYFDVAHERYLGGAVAYDVLTFNDAFFDPSTDTRTEVMDLLAADAAYRAPDPSTRSMFAYLIATPRKQVLADEAQLAEWTEEEQAREHQATSAGGRYYPPTMLEAVYERIYLLERAAYANGIDVPGVDIPRRGLLLRQLRPIVARLPGSRRLAGYVRSRMR